MTMTFDVAVLLKKFALMAEVLRAAAEVIETDTVILFGCARPNQDFLESQRVAVERLSDCAQRFDDHWPSVSAESLGTKEQAEILLDDARLVLDAARIQVMDLVQNPGGLSGEEISAEGGSAYTVDQYLRNTLIPWLRFEVLGE